MAFQLIQFRIPRFRSVINSEWIKANDITGLVGTNESGKTNILLALWKLNPANNERIFPLDDYPRKDFSIFDSTNGEEYFVEADFSIDEKMVTLLSDKLSADSNLIKVIRVCRKYNGEYSVSFPMSKIHDIEKNKIQESFNIAIKKIEEIPDWSGSELEHKTHEYLRLYNLVKDKYSIDDLQEIKDSIQKYKDTETGRKQKIKDFIDDIIQYLDKNLELIKSGIQEIPDDLKSEVIGKLPKFVYYSDYGNLDAEIYLPHVIQNLSRTDLGEKERAKARTLSVLFSFVNLKPQEILDLGKETNNRRYNQQGQLIQDQAYNEKVIQEEAENKRKREVLLKSASSRLTQEFKQWWGQGDYIFRFDADGNHFRIWVSDSLRPEEVELEGRSKGLQWFFSFYLVFLVESQHNHENCIILLDEPGASLHPIAQRDLSLFLKKLSISNQLVYTTHSPFLVDNSSIENIRAVYVDSHGNSSVSHDLRKNNKTAEKSIYPVHASLGLTVSDTLLLGCKTILVEGPSDHIYLHLIKKYLLRKSLYTVKDEIMFVPTGGVRGMTPIINILFGKDSTLPFVILDSDGPGKEKEDNLKKNLYKSQQNKIITIRGLTGIDNIELEDILPLEELARVFSKKYRGKDIDFDYSFNKSEPIIDQMEKFAQINDHKLEDGWKVELASDFSRIFETIIPKIDDSIEKIWVKLFDELSKD